MIFQKKIPSLLKSVIFVVNISGLYENKGDLGQFTGEVMEKELFREFAFVEHKYMK